ncbi:MAG: pyrimidine dimer DNA glycosylase/endonuclease V [Planctomycetota bacterium]
MRLWSLHPRYLDPKGLVAVWREGLLAQAVLTRGKTCGYARHPQLERFRKTFRPSAFLAEYLRTVYNEGRRRGYRFDASKIAPLRTRGRLTISRNQIAFEWRHLKRKVASRAPTWSLYLEGIRRPRPHPLFKVVPGPIAPWERGATSEGKQKAPRRG